MEHLTNPSLCCFALIPYSTYVNSENNLINDCRDLDQKDSIKCHFLYFSIADKRTQRESS